MMQMTFERLSQKLHLTPSYEQNSQLAALDSWCLEHISQDLRCTEDPEKQYRFYYSLASDYLNGFIPHLTKDLSQKIPEFGNRSAIQYATQKGYDRFISAQSKMSPKVLHDANSYGMTPLHTSTTDGFYHTTLALLKHGADVTRLNQQNELPLHRVFWIPGFHNQDNIENKERIFKALLPDYPSEKEALQQKDKAGNTVLHQMVKKGFTNTASDVLKKYPDLALLKNNASHYPVHSAILNQQAKNMELLLHIKGVDKQVDKDQQSALHYVARYGTAPMVHCFSHDTSIINARDDKGMTPLLCAAEAGNQNVLQALMENKADSTALDFRGFSILHYAVKQKNETMLRWILEHSTHEEQSKMLAFSPLDSHSDADIEKLLQQYSIPLHGTAMNNP